MKNILKSENKLIPVNKPVVSKDDINSVVKSLKENWISSEGPYVKKFEENYAKYHKRKYGIAVSSGTAALEIALKSLNYYSYFFDHLNSTMCNKE